MLLRGLREGESCTRVRNEVRVTLRGESSFQEEREKEREEVREEEREGCTDCKDCNG